MLPGTTNKKEGLKEELQRPLANRGKWASARPALMSRWLFLVALRETHDYACVG